MTENYKENQENVFEVNIEENEEVHILGIMMKQAQNIASMNSATKDISEEKNDINSKNEVRK